MRRALHLCLTLPVFALLGPSLPLTARADETCAVQHKADAACPGVRPGAALRASDVTCTIGFLLKASDGRRYAIVGHPCGEEARGTVTVGSYRDETFWPVGKGPAVTDSAGHQVGRMVYDLAQTVPFTLDVALMVLDAGVPYSSTVCGFGGPTAIDRSITSEPTELSVYGAADPVPATGQFPHGRSDMALRGLDDPRLVFAAGVHNRTDSGSPVLLGDRAVGMLSAATRADPEAVGNEVYRIDPLLKHLEKRLHRRFTLLLAGQR